MNKNQNRHFVSKGWEDWICNNEKYCGKRMFCKAGKKCSWHYHKEKDETFLIESGELLLHYYKIDKSLRLENEIELFIKDMLFFDNYYSVGIYEMVLKQGDSFHIPVTMRHRFTALSDCYFTEFSTHHEDSDSYRIINGD